MTYPTNNNNHTQSAISYIQYCNDITRCDAYTTYNTKQLTCILYDTYIHRSSTMSELVFQLCDNVSTVHNI